MIVCFFLISNSFNKDKAIAFFEIFDEDMIKVINTRQVYMFVCKCYGASLNRLPYLTKEQGEQHSKVCPYIDKLAVHGENFIEDTVNIIMKGQSELSQQQFVDIIVRDAPFIVSSSGTRREIYNNYVLKCN